MHTLLWNNVTRGSQLGRKKVILRPSASLGSIYPDKRRAHSSIRNPLSSTPRLKLEPTNEKMSSDIYQETLIMNIGIYDKLYQELMEDKTVASSLDASAIVLQMVIVNTALATHNSKTHQRD
jgi:hypothetical protein